MEIIKLVFEFILKKLRKKKQPYVKAVNSIVIILKIDRN